MANPISSDNFLADQAVKQRKPDSHPGSLPATGEKPGRPAARSADRADIGPARQLLSQESLGLGEPAITSANEARRRVALLKQQLNDSPAAAAKAHGAMNGDVFEAATAVPAA